MKLYTCLLMGVTLTTLTACASFPDERYPVDQGWRIAHLQRTVLSTEALPTVGADHDCRTRVPVSETSAHTWALVHFRRPPGIVYSVIPIDAATDLQPGDAFYADVGHCAHALVPRVSEGPSAP